jgi:hypothetical protein
LTDVQVARSKESSNNRFPPPRPGTHTPHLRCALEFAHHAVDSIIIVDVSLLPACTPPDRHRRPHRYRKSSRAQRSTREHGNNLRCHASLTPACAVWSAHSWHVAAICCSDPSLPIANVTEGTSSPRRCMYTPWLITGQSSTKVSPPKALCGYTKPCCHVMLREFTSPRQTSGCRVVRHCAWASS